METVLARLKGVRKSIRGWVACCPAHDDREPSLSIGLGDEGHVLLKCFAGCTLDSIVEAMELTVSDLFPDAPSSSDSQAKQTSRNSLSLVDLAQDIPLASSQSYLSRCTGLAHLHEECFVSQEEEFQKEVGHVLSCCYPNERIGTLALGINHPEFA
jgi:hypothetical protein